MPQHYTGRRNLILLSAFILCLPALAAGLMGDDYMHYALLTADLPIAKPNDLSLFGLFSFINGDPERNRLLMDYSLIPWWTYAELKYAFWRPLSEIFHWVDHQLWPEQPWLMHLNNIAWYMIALCLVARLYKQYLPTAGTALLALFLYGLDSTHGFTISWISNRNALLALTFGLLTFLLYARWREDGGIGSLMLSLLTLLLGLLSAELGISVFGYIGAYALFMDKRGPVKGVLATLPYFAVIVGWWAIYKYAGFGAAHADAYYVDPASQPLSFFMKAAERLPVLLASQWGIVPADLYTLSGASNYTYVAICAVMLILSLIPVLMVQIKNRATLFWLFGMLFSILPALAASPYDRLLLFPGIGASALLANFLIQIKLKRYTPSSSILKTYTTLIFFVMVFIHLIMAPILLPVMAYSTKFMSDQVSSTPSYFQNIENIEHKKLVLFSPPLASSLAIAALRYHRQDPIPARIWTITTLDDGLQYHASGNRLLVSREAGFIDGPIEESVRNMEKYPFQENDEVILSGLRIGIHKLNESGKPSQLSLTFDQPVNSSEYVFLKWDANSNQYTQLDF
ncbi:MAG: hypothetical protein GY938_15270 [Ketobacter sp.]|nr:hypothetical protein [Ketobacter sp.]